MWKLHFHQQISRVLPPPSQRPLKGRRFLSAATLYLTLRDWHIAQRIVGEGGMKIRVVATNATNTVECLLFARYSPERQERSTSNTLITDEVMGSL